MEDKNFELIKKILKQENIEFKNLEKSTSGFTNVVFFVDDDYVVKIVAQNTKPEKLQKEIGFYKNVKLTGIPKYIASGEVEGVEYLILEKLKGQSLYSIWHTLTNEKRKNVVEQICEILNGFHKLPFEFLPEKNIVKDWKQKWGNSFSKNISILKDKGFDVEFLEEFAKTQLPQIMEEQDLCLIYNDAHFDNFLLFENKLALIDFDRIMYGSVDYELLIIKSMLDAPHKFASEIDEPNVNPKHYAGIWEMLKMLCPQMFDFEHIDKRVFIYQFIYNLGNAYEWNHDDWVEQELNKFKQFFDIK